MNRLVPILSRLPWPPPGGLRTPPRPAPDPGARAGAWVVALSTLTAFAVYLVASAQEAAALTPEFTRTLLTQIGIAPVPTAFREAIGIDSPLGALGEFLVSAYSLMPLYGLAALFDNPAGVPAVLAVRAACQALNLAGAPLLYAAARRSGLRDRASTLVALAYLLSPFLADKIGWDVIGYMGTPLIGAWWALQAGRPGLAVVAWLVAAGGHPFCLWGIAFWAVAEWIHAERSGRPSTALRLAALWFPLQAALNVANIFLMPVLAPHSMAGYMRQHVSGERFRLDAMGGHLLALAGFLAGFLFLPLARARWLLVAFADLLYYAGTGLQHGLVPATTGLMALASVEALLDGQAGVGAKGAKGPFRRLAAWVARQAARPVAGRGLCAGLAVALLGANLLFPQGNAYHEAVRGMDWDAGWIAGVRDVAARVPPDTEQCLVQPYAFAAVDGHCPRVLPWSWPETAEVVDPGMARTAFVLSVDLWDRSRHPLRTMLARRDIEVRGMLCEGLDDGVLRVAAVSGNACLLLPSWGDPPPGTPTCPGLCPAPHGEGEGGPGHAGP